MRLRTFAILFVSALFAASPAFAQMTQQNRSNQGNAAHPPTASSVNQGNTTAANQSNVPAAKTTSTNGNQVAKKQ
jgi:hypothetical protein